MSANFPKLLAPLEMSGFTVRNRVLMGSMHTGLEEAKGGFERMARFYADRAAGGVGLIVTGGVAPNAEGAGMAGGSKLSTEEEAEKHKVVPQAVHEAGGLICMQILHTGRYAYSPKAVGPSDIKAPINMFKPRALSTEEVWGQIGDYIKCAELAQSAGYDGVEVMGSEGYFINQFIAERVNNRTDEFGGSYENRIKVALEIVKGIREACGEKFIIIFRLSMLDLVEGGSTWEEVIQLAEAVEAVGASMINTGIGWHEARIPTIATRVPRATFVSVTKKLYGAVNIPLCTTNRINMPDVAEAVLEEGTADMVSMARPFLADADLVNKAQEGRVDEINTCIGCNQACLDHIFQAKMTSCLVNPRACHETLLNVEPLSESAIAKKVAVIGAGPAGLAASTELARKGHQVDLYDASDRIGGQFNLARQVPGKEEFNETLRYFSKQLELTGVSVHLNTFVKAEDLIEKGYDSVTLATGIVPRVPDIEGIDHPSVCSYIDILSGKVQAGNKVAIMGAGGIGVDVAEYLTHASNETTSTDPLAFMKSWGIDPAFSTRGGLSASGPAPEPSPRKIYLLQRKATKVGKTLGKTTGWAHIASLKLKQVDMIPGCEYLKVDDSGFHIRVGDQEQVLDIDTLVVCAGQEPLRALQAPLEAAGIDVHLIGGADKAGELDAKRAIKQGTELAVAL